MRSLNAIAYRVCARRLKITKKIYAMNSPKPHSQVKAVSDMEDSVEDLSRIVWLYYVTK